MRFLAWLAFSALGVLAAGLTGCTVGSGTAASVPGAKGTISGTVHGGQQPITGATIQLWAISVAGDGTAATRLLSPAVTTDGTGSFTITNLFTCSNYTTGAEAGTDELIYLTATGGNPGLPAGQTNSNIALMTTLGDCLSFQDPSIFLQVNEVTTIAAVAEMAPYMTSYSAVGSGDSDFNSMVGNLLESNALVNPTTGVTLTTQVGPTIAETIYALSDMIASCINSAGGVAGDGSACGNLFLYATPPSGPAPTDTVGAMLNIQKFPSQNVANLFRLIPAGSPFEPALTVAPANWAVVPAQSGQGEMQTFTATGNGIVQIPLSTGMTSSAFVAAALYTGGSTQNLTFVPVLGTPTLPLNVTICQTNMVGTCLAAPAGSATGSFTTGATPTFSIFVTAAGAVPYNPLANVIYVQMLDSFGNVLTTAKVAVETD
jgi:trimeric autotransporter adhesin